MLLYFASAFLKQERSDRVSRGSGLDASMRSLVSKHSFEGISLGLVSSSTSWRNKSGISLTLFMEENKHCTTKHSSFHFVSSIVANKECVHDLRIGRQLVVDTL